MVARKTFRDLGNFDLLNRKETTATRPIEAITNGFWFVITRSGPAEILTNRASWHTMSPPTLIRLARRGEEPSGMMVTETFVSNPLRASRGVRGSNCTDCTETSRCVAPRAKRPQAAKRRHGRTRTSPTAGRVLLCICQLYKSVDESASKSERM
jgi:hypothetical protein